MSDQLKLGMPVFDHLYVAKGECGHVMAGCVDDRKRTKDTAKNVADWIADGLTVSRVSAHEPVQWCNDQCPVLIERRARRGQS